MEKSSAVLNYLQEQTQMIDGDHSQIAKLKPGQGGVYPNVLRVIKDGLQSASEQYAAFIRKEVDPPLSAAAQPLPIRVSSTRSTAGDGEDSGNESGYSVKKKANPEPARVIPKESDAPRPAQNLPTVTVSSTAISDDEDDDELGYSVDLAKQAEQAERYEG